MKFEELSTGWKALSIMGIVFTLLCIVLLILIILMLETDLIPWPIIETPSEDELEDEFGEFLQQFEFGAKDDTSKSEIMHYKHPIYDLDRKPLLDLLDINLVI